MVYLEDMAGSVHIVARVMRTVALLSDETEANIQKEKIAIARKIYNDAFSALGKMPLDDTGKAFIVKIQEDQTKARALNDKFIEMAKTDKDAAVKFLLKDVVPVNNEWQNQMHDFTELQREKNKRDEELAVQSYRNALVFMLVLTGLAVVAGTGIAWFVTCSITGPVYAAVKIAKKVASGDLTSHIEVNSKDEMGELLQSLKEMNSSLQTIVSEVRSGTDNMAAASSQIASGNMDLSSRTEQQASSLEETASSMEELTSTVQQNADNARQANSLAQTASDVASRGGSVVSEVVDTMSSINESAKKIVDIISVIDGIAFQTNILALNAAVEAARAGEQGRGFAVVAAEVRNLAQRSASAAKEIKTLIGDSVEKVEAGTKLVDLAGTTMQEVVDSVRRVTDVISEITAASQEQSTGIEQINYAITEMDNVTQQNAALVEEAAAAAGSLQEQASKLAHVVSVFIVSGTPAMTSGFANAQRVEHEKRSERARPVLARSLRPALHIR